MLVVCFRFWLLILLNCILWIVLFIVVEKCVFKEFRVLVIDKFWEVLLVIRLSCFLMWFFLFVICDKLMEVMKCVFFLRLVIIFLIMFICCVIMLLNLVEWVDNVCILLVIIVNFWFVLFVFVVFIVVFRVSKLVCDEIVLILFKVFFMVGIVW